MITMTHAGKVLFSELGKRWLASRFVDPSTIRYETVYRLHVLPDFGRHAQRARLPLP